MILSILSTALCAAAILTAAGGACFPKGGGWEKLGDMIIIVLIVGVLSILSTLTGVLSWSYNGEWSLPAKISTFICAIPALGTVVMLVMFAARK